MKPIPPAVTTLTVFWDVTVIFKKKLVTSSKFRCSYANEGTKLSLNVLDVFNICLPYRLIGCHIASDNEGDLLNTCRIKRLNTSSPKTMRYKQLFVQNVLTLLIALRYLKKKFSLGFMHILLSSVFSVMLLPCLFNESIYQLLY
jgi:hypothetical protein